MDLMNCIATETMSVQSSRAARARLVGDASYAWLPVNSVALSVAGADLLGAPAAPKAIGTVDTVDIAGMAMSGVNATTGENVKPWTATTTCTRFCMHHQRLKEHLFV